jgi:O-sialoglycoprotein endopeptidase (EC 3.4.24.57)
VSVPDVAASFRESVADVLTSKAIAACLRLGVPRLLLGGGVVANARVRELAQERADAAGSPCASPPVAVHRQRRDDRGARRTAHREGHQPSRLDVGADSTLPVTTIQA